MPTTPKAPKLPTGGKPTNGTSAKNMGLNQGTSTTTSMMSNDPMHPANMGSSNIGVTSSAPKKVPLTAIVKAPKVTAPKTPKIGATINKAATKATKASSAPVKPPKAPKGI